MSAEYEAAIEIREELVNLRALLQDSAIDETRFFAGCALTGLLSGRSIAFVSDLDIRAAFVRIAWAIADDMAKEGQEHGEG